MEKIFWYVEAYNEMNVESMITDFADEIDFFSEREQSIESITHNSSSNEITINYRAIVAMGFPNGLKKVMRLA